MEVTLVPVAGVRHAPLAFGRFWGKDDPAKPQEIEEVRVIRHLAATIGLLVVLAPAIASAQTNLDQGKSPGQIFASDCAACHKAARGLAKGKDGGSLTEFLRQHYTTSREQAAALAAYVLRGGVEPPPKPAAEHARASAEEPKAGRRQSRSEAAKPEAGKPEAAKPEAAKPDGASPATAKLQAPASEEAKPDDVGAPAEAPKPAATGRHEKNEKRPQTATRGRRKDGGMVAPAMPAAAPEPAAVMAEPSPTATPNSEPTPAPTAAAPEAAPSEGAPVPRDDIPD